MKKGDRFGNYLVVEMLGSGASSTVWRVRHSLLQSSHALKVLSVDSGTLEGRLVQEGRIQAELVHPNIVRVTDIVELGGRVGLVMDFVEGVSLREFLRVEGRMAAPEALELFRQILSAIEAAHAAGILHRDLKPDNVLLSQDGNRVVARVTDFGIAKVLSGVLRASETRDGTMMGSPGYMAPEQIEDAATASPRSDLFAAGSILYEMLAGVPPFEGTAIERMDRTRSGKFAPLRKVAPEVSPQVADAVTACLQRDPERRPATVADLRARLYPDSTLVKGLKQSPPKPWEDEPTNPGGRSPIAPRDAFARRVLTGAVVASLLLVAAALAFVLSRDPAPVPDVAVVPPIDATPPPVEDAAVPEPARGPTGKLTIEVRPTSTIRIDGTTVGRGHYTGHVRAGTHLVELRCVDGRKLQERIDVAANGEARFCWDFDANAECAP